MDRMGFQMPHMVNAPPMMNPPPQIFGGYAPDGMQMQLPPELAAQMFGDPATLLDDTNEAKRRRIARACDMCRKKKIKCDGRLPACSHCTNYKTECHFSAPEKKRTPPKGAKYVEGLENRLGRMENVLRLSGLLDDDDNGELDLGSLEKKLQERQQSRQASMAAVSSPSSPSIPAAAAQETSSTPQSSLTSPEPMRDSKDGSERHGTAPPEDGDKPEEVEELSEMMCSLVTNNQGETRYIGSSSGFSIFSPKGIQWVNEKTGDDSFQRMITDVSIDDHKWTNWKPEIFGDLFRRPIFVPLPSKQDALSLLRDYFENFNCMFPLFHQPTFMHLVERQYSNDPYQGSGWWASLNCALAFAYRLRVMSNLVAKEEDEKAWAHLKNAMACFSELTMRNTDLLSVQALLAMALFLQGTPNPQPTILFVAAAIRLSHTIGLHKKGTGFHLNPIEIEQRKRVFWIAYMLDKDFSLRAGRPPAQDDDDMNVELPDADPEDNIGNIPLGDGKGKMNLFRVMCEFAQIEGKVYSRLYSTKALKQSPGELLNTIGELDKELEEWKDRIPIDFRPEHEIKASHTPLILHVIMLHLTYYNCLTTMHRMSVHHGYWTSRLSNYAIQGLNTKPLNPRIFSSAALCTAAARASISLLRFCPQGDVSVVWLVLYFPVSALMTLFSHILQNPLDARARSDAKLMNVVVTYLSMLGQDAETGGIHRMLGVCSEFERVARSVIDKAEKEQSSKRKRKADSSKTINVPDPLSSTPRPSATTPTGTGQNGVNDGHLSPKFNGEANRARNQYSAMDAAVRDTSPAVQSVNSMGWPQDFRTPNQQDYNAYGDFNGFGGPDGLASPPNMMGGFQQPLLPQDLFSLPMTLDWDWAEMSGGAYPTVENGNVGDMQR
ncbi:fungal-specific transcription factor domain-containing protein [Plectosphaerella plurivora]|uniref:Fungal-specific transcription factor domain-containing protein n=1 Tax=Plectosphaerella plurivora TaxID=936078 RepID=A0A9P8VAR6_9PEZI|nr:fungal-specific transcription factor domain-containing protein [Plectosphaerella plurivora]